MLISGMEKPEDAIDEFISEDDIFPQGSINGKLQEIDPREIELKEAIGKGSFGVVRKAFWRDLVVAVKQVETDTEVIAFQNEIKQLSRIQHENIIHMYGVASALYSKYLVMELADGGSLYDFLHCQPYLKYSISHALSWLLQCAKAIDYLHSYQPKPIVHRDLKPLNMLLTNGRKCLKVCDFGTACVLRSTMTDNRGSIAWMAPEVMKGESYDQKCDVYSWGLILWEVLTRRIPFEEWGLPIRIACQVIKNKRPPPILGCPKPLENLITSCWSDAHASRPSMQHVLEVMTPLYRVLTGGDEPVCYISSSSEDSLTESFMSLGNESSDHTSIDVSEFPSTSNTMDLSYSQCSRSPTLTPSSSTSAAENTCDSSPISASSKLPVMNPNCQMWRRESTNFHPTSFSPYQNAKAIFEKKTWPPPLRSPMSTSLKRTTKEDQPDASKSSPIYAPLTIAIPNPGPPERNDVIVCDVKDEPMIPFSETLVRPAHSSHQPRIGDQAACLSPQVTNDQISESSSDSHAYVPKELDKRESGFGKHGCSLPSSINIMSATPHNSNDSLDLTSCARSGHLLSPEATNAVVSRRRHHLAPHPLASLRRRSAEILEEPSQPKIQGHKRSSSYGSSSLIGFEPLANQISEGMEDATSTAGEIGSTSEGNFQYIGEASAPRSFTRVHPTIKSSQKAPVPTNPTPHYRANPAERGGSPAIGDKDDLGAFWELLDNDLKPLKPLPNVPSSREVFEQHKKLAHEILVEQENIVYLEQKKAELVSQLGKQDKSHKSSQQRYNEKITQLQNKNEGLRGYQLRLSQQLNEIKRKRQACQQQTSPPQHHPSPQANPHTYHHLTQQPPSNLPNPAPYQQQHHLYYHQPHQNLPSQHPPHDLPHQHTNHLCCDPHCQARASNPHQNRPQHSSMYPHLQKQ